MVPTREVAARGSDLERIQVRAAFVRATAPRPWEAVAELAGLLGLPVVEVTRVLDGQAHQQPAEVVRLILDVTRFRAETGRFPAVHRVQPISALDATAPAPKQPTLIERFWFGR